jgi:hypothetical protein
MVRVRSWGDPDAFYMVGDTHPRDAENDVRHATHAKGSSTVEIVRALTDKECWDHRLGPGIIKPAPS